MIHELKIHPEFFEAVTSGKKTFETRFADRDYREGDLLALNEYTENGYTGRCCLVKIDYILNVKDYVPKGFVTMSIKPCNVGIYDGFDICHNRNIFAVPLVDKQPAREEAQP